ncbi:hypothetical protein ACJVC5_08590 [Peredibacter sp. HCB2-198]|uniref:hypothetical protein n=1 Tax=Peredibacter sp. HCB2-198 TaxID=3383025 RepID=UPI0038B4962C
MTIRRLIYAKFLVLTSLWWGWTVLVDFFIIPTVFKTIDIFFKAGDLGIAVFSKLNNLEVFVGSVLVALLAYQVTKNKKALPILIMSIVAWFIAMTYFTFLTPKLIEITELWKTTDLMGLTGVAEYPDLQQAHQFYHRLYIGTDVFKLVLLTVMLAYGIWKEEEWR